MALFDWVSWSVWQAIRTQNLVLGGWRLHWPYLENDVRWRWKSWMRTWKAEDCERDDWVTYITYWIRRSNTNSFDSWAKFIFHFWSHRESSIHRWTMRTSWHAAKSNQKGSKWSDSASTSVPRLKFSISLARFRSYLAVSFVVEMDFWQSDIRQRGGKGGMFVDFDVIDEFHPKSSQASER